jgi:protein-histidine N-methyltransferase
LAEAKQILPEDEKVKNFEGTIEIYWRSIQSLYDLLLALCVSPVQIKKYSTFTYEKITIADNTVLQKFRKSAKEIVADNERETEIVEIYSKNDLAPGLYEGGFKLWECSLDLVDYLAEKVPKTNTSRSLLFGKKVLEVRRLLLQYCTI